MVYHQFPDLQWLKSQVENNFANRSAWEGRSLPNKGWPTVVLNVNTENVYRDNIRGPISIFTNLSGESHVSIHGKSVRVQSDLFFVTNHDQHYTLEVGKKRAETCNIHFGEYFSEQVFDSLNKKVPALLENDRYIKPFGRIEFTNRLRYKSERFNILIRQVLDTNENTLLLEEKLYELMALLLEDDVVLKKSASALPVMKSATREEISKRMMQATDYIYTNLDKDVSLEELATASCLSKFHFLRLFKIYFQKTPYQFIAEAKTNRAKSLLRNTKNDVIAIARSLGYRDASTFSRSFYNQVGVYPTQYR